MSGDQAIQVRENFVTTQLKNRKEGEALNMISRYYAWVWKRGILASMLSRWSKVLIFKACFEKKKRDLWSRGQRRSGRGLSNAP